MSSTSARQRLSPRDPQRLPGKAPHVAIVEARFYAHLNDMLIAGARAALRQAGHEVEVLTVPGALEVPGAIALAEESDQFDGGS